MSQETQTRFYLHHRAINDKYTSLLKELNKISVHGNNVGGNLESFVDDCKVFLGEICDDSSQYNSSNQTLCSEVFNYLETLFVSILHSIEETIKNKTKSEVQLLQICLHIVEVLSDALCFIIETFTEQEGLTTLASYYDMPKFTLHVILCSYEHCKSSENVYGTSFALVTSLLGELFRKTFNLQKVLSNLLSKITIPEKKIDNQELLDDYIQICKYLLDISCIAGDMDNTLLGTTWKVLSSFILKFKPVFEEKLDLRPYINEITSKVKDYMEHCANINKQHNSNLCNEDGALLKDLNISMRMACFFNNLLANLLNEYSASIKPDIKILVVDYIFVVIEIIVSFLLVISNNEPKCPQGFRKMINNLFLVDIDKIFALLVDYELFRSRVTEMESSEKAKSLTQIFIISRLAKPDASIASDLWFGSPCDDNISSNGLFQFVFKVVDNLCSEFIQSAVICDGEDEIPVYQFILSRLCEAVSSVSSFDFAKLELILFKNLTSGKPFGFLLSCDIWCFVARRCSPKLCYHHVTLLIKLVLSFDACRLTQSQHRVCLFLKRLFMLLRRDHQQALVSTYSLDREEYYVIHQFLGPCFVRITDNSLQFVGSVCRRMEREIHKWLGSEGLVSELQVLLLNFRITTNLLNELLNNHDESLKRKLNDPLLKLGSASVSLWKALPTASNATTCLNVLFEELFALTSLLLPPFISTEDIFIILKKANEVIKCLHSNHPSHRLLFGCIKLLSSLRFSALPLNVLDEFIRLWKVTLYDCCEANWLLRHKSFDAFETFSRVTKHPQVLAQICSKKEPSRPDISLWFKSHLKREVVGFCEDIPLSDVFYLSSSSDPSSGERKLFHVIEDVTRSVRKLENYSTEDLHCEDVAALRDALNTISIILPHQSKF